MHEASYVMPNMLACKLLVLSIVMFLTRLTGTDAQFSWQAIPASLMTQSLANASDVIGQMNIQQMFSGGAYITNLISASFTTDSNPV